LLISLELFAFGVILLFGARRLGRGRPKVDFLAHVAAGAALALSLVVGLTAFSAGENGMLALRNPIPPDSASLARGQKLYQDNCLACHGATGAGDGPLGLALRPQPANLQTHMTDGHPDGLLFDWVTNGVQGTAMPAFGARLSERERWDVINFIRTFARP
jgi:putative copper resistance protein D